MSSAELIGKLRPLFAPKKLHVLDGHARYEGMLAYAAKINADGNCPKFEARPARESWVARVTRAMRA